MSDIQDRLQATLSGAYTIERELGGGGMSRVFVADEFRLGRKVVVKVLSPELAAGISAERFQREIRLAASLQQANIVPLLSTGESGGLPYYTMPYVEGESLRHRLGAGPLPISDVLRVLGEVARALQYAHDRGIVHRDIKPDNVLLSGGTAVVTDFGIAKALSASRTGPGGATLTQLGTSIGTPAYMAPEQAAGDPNVDHRADLYALGCMAYELLAGQPPFHGRTPQRVLAAHMSEPPEDIATRRADAPAALSQLVMRLLHKDADERPQSAAEVILALNAVTSGAGMQAMPPVLLQGRGALRRALLVYAVSFIGVALVAKAAMMTIGLPDWVLPGALALMALGLPVILFTGYVQKVARRSLIATPALTPGGTPRPQGTMATLAMRASPHVSWKRATRGGVYALGGFVVVVVAFMLLRAFGIGPAGSLFASGQLKQRDMLLVSDFNVSRADSSVASVVAEGVRANLAQSNSITLYSPANIPTALRRMQHAPTERLELPLARQLARREGIKAIVTGDITGIGGGFIIGLKLVTADSGAVLATYQTTVDGPKDLVSGIDDLSRKLRGKIGESLKSVQNSPPLAQVTTASYEALKAFSQANELADRDNDYAAAVPLLRRAVQIDTGFASAWRKLAVVLNNSHVSPSAADSAINNAYRLRDRLSDNERYLTEAYYFSTGPQRNRSREMQAYQALIDRGDSIAPVVDMATVYTVMHQHAKADSLLRIALRHDPNNMVAAGNLLGGYVNEGKRAAFDSLAKAALARNPNASGVVVEFTEAPYVFDDDLDKSLRLTDSVRRATPSRTVRYTEQQDAVSLLAVEGRLRESETAARESDFLADSLGMNVPAVVDSMDFALYDAWYRNNPARAVSRLDAMLAANPLTTLAPLDRPYAKLAYDYALAGSVDHAKAMLKAIADLHDPTYADVGVNWGWIHGALGEIAIDEHRPKDALAEFRTVDTWTDGAPLGAPPSWIDASLGRAFDLAGEPDSAIAHFERASSEPDAIRMFFDPLFRASSEKRLGELYEAKGDRANAIKHLTKFVRLWKHADPELQPAVRDAQQRIARLQKQRGG
jgi:tetratricopeptide (TPR) repeat protein